MAPFLLKNCIGKYVELHSWKSSMTDAKMWQWLVILGYKITRGIVFLFFPYVLSISFCLKNSFIFFKKKKEASYIIKEKNPIWWTVFDTHATFPTSLYRSSTSCLSLRPVSSLRKYLAGDSRRAELFCEGWGPLGGPPSSSPGSAPKVLGVVAGKPRCWGPPTLTWPRPRPRATWPVTRTGWCWEWKEMLLIITLRR